MASTNKTPNLELPQWEISDKLEMADFNDANEKIDTVVSTHLAESVTQLALKANKEQEDWIEPTLLNGWVNFGATLAKASFYKDTLGNVHLKGLIKDGVTTMPTNIFILPIGYRPADILSFPAYTDNGNVAGAIQITNKGEIQVIKATNTNLSLVGIYFRAV